MDKKWLVVGGIAVMFFMCAGMTFIPLALGMGRQMVYYPPVASNGEAPAQPYPMMPMHGGYWGGHRILMLLPMLACGAFPLILLALGGLLMARRHGWTAMHGEGAEAHWRRHHHHWRHFCDPAPQPAAETESAVEDRPEG